MTEQALSGDRLVDALLAVLKGLPATDRARLAAALNVEGHKHE